MESLKLRTSLNTSKLLPQIDTLGNASLSYAKSHVIGSEATPMVMEGKSLHQRCSSESFLLEQPSWLDDLLNEPETLVYRGHRRSSSDSSTYLGPVAKLFDSASGPCWGFQISVNDKDPWHKMPTSSHKQHNNVSESSFNSVICTTSLSSAPKESKWLSTSAFKDSGYESLGGSTQSTSGHQIKNSVSKAEAKRTKQPSAHRSRIRKLQYIADLERNMQALQARCGDGDATERNCKVSNGVPASAATTMPKQQ
ncbi:hypothetical protein RHSIM_Rhsim06G0113800 [Rhododendron simsii]|uniref:Uncharacterized protein n=1 Tax=Rhododendron simsii TaxID=118357 RepID=A0A834H4M6_RHOSS|nr:hypothetical protein RHSIM_Rhsim06G0113800 [Rhododendron simsii]